MARITVRTLGGLRIAQAGEEIRDLPGQPVRCALFLYLALERNASRQELAALLWPESDDERARRALSQTLYELRRRLGDGWLDLRGDHLSVTDDVVVDLSDLIAAVEAGRDEDALVICGGQLLEGCHIGNSPGFEEWVERRRAEVARLQRDLCRRLCAARRAAGDDTGALAAARRWAQLEPLEDEAHHQIVELLADAGQRTEALQHYEHYRLLIARELEVEPLEQTKELVAAIREGAATASAHTSPNSPALEPRTKGAPPTSLPRRSHRLPGVLAAAFLAAMLLLWGGAKLRPAAGTAAESAALDPRGIAVLPFVNLSTDPEQEYFSDGITEDLLTALSRIRELRVISRTSVTRYKRTERSIPEIARELGVRYVLEGSVRREEDQVRITAQLIDAANDVHVWASAYDRQLSGIFEIQSEIAQQIARALQGELTAAERARFERGPTSNLTAYDYLLQAREFIRRPHPRNTDAALVLLRRARDLDPSYADVHAALSDAFRWKQWFEGDRFWLDSAEVAARQTIVLDPELAQGYAELGWTLDFAGDPEGSLEAHRQAVARNPNLSGGLANLLHSSFGRFDEAVRWWTPALERDPTNSLFYWIAASTYLELGMLDRARALLVTALEFQPDAWPPHIFLAYLYLEEGRPDEARAQVQRLLDDVNHTPSGMIHVSNVLIALGDRQTARRYLEQNLESVPDWDRAMGTLWLAELLVENGEVEQAQALARDAAHLFENRWGGEPKRTEDFVDLARIRVLEGDHEAAVRLMEDAVHRGWRRRSAGGRWFLKPLRGEPRFEQLMAEVVADIERQRALVEREGW